MARSHFGNVQTVIPRKKYRLRWWGDAHDGRGYRQLSETFYGTLKQAHARMAEHQVVHGGDAPCPTVGDVWRRNVVPEFARKVAEGTRAQTTAYSRESVWRVHVEPRWASVQCSDVRPADVQGWLLSVPPSQAVACKALLGEVLSRARMLELVESNVADLPYDMPAKARREREAYGPDELHTIAGAVRGTVCEVPFLLSAYAGLRVGEACGVGLDCVRFREEGGVCVCVVEVRRQLVGSGAVTERLKTRSSRRTVAIAGEVAVRLREIAASLPSDALWLNDDGCGRPVSRRTVAYTWSKALRGLDAVRPLPLQSLRPSFETNAHWGDGAAIEKVARAMGHSSTRTTLSHYDRPDDAALEAQAVAFALENSYHL